MTSQEQYKFFHLLTTKPEIWSKYTAYDLWADEYISQKMLAYHLDATSELASRPHDFINRSVQWITSRFKLPSGQKVIDFGCGPGMYTNGFHDAGAHVTGIDFSPRSIEYARRSAQQENRSIKYVQGNYLDVDLGDSYNLVTMIYCDFCALSPTQRKNLLYKMGAVLEPDGKIILDVFSLAAFYNRLEGSEITRNLMGGFWSAEDYVGVRQTWKYNEEKVVLDKYEIYEEHRSRVVYNWLQYYNLDSLKGEMLANGFRIIEWYSDVAGKAFDAESPTIAVVIEKVL